MSWLGRMGLVCILIIGTVSYAWGHETDQYTLPPGREFADLGTHFNQWFYEVIERAVDRTNGHIRDHLNAKASDESLKDLQSPDTIANAVNRELPWAMDVIEGFEKWIDRPEVKRMYPGRVVGYKEKFTNIYQHVHFPLDPRQFFRLFLGSTMKVYGVYLGTDKIGHFTDMGMNYYHKYRKSLSEGKSEQQAVADAVYMGTHGLIFSERGMLGYLSAGAYSNADLAANYLGFLFYKNLTEPVMLKGKLVPPMLVHDGPYWKIADHVRRDSDFFAAFISDHLNEALNPSLFEADMRSAVRDAVRKRSEIILERYCDERNIPRTPDYFTRRVQELSTYFGVDYGHEGTLDELITIANTCFSNDAIASKKSPRKPIYLSAIEGAVRPDADDADGRTALHAMVMDPKAPSISLLLAKGADVNARDHQGRTPLYCAIEAANAKAVGELVDKGAQVNACDPFNISAVHLAAARKDSVILRLLLDRTANAMAKDDFGRTPLHEAARVGSLENIQLLLQAGADVNAPDLYGTTPLHLACRNSHLLVAKALAQRGAKIDAQNAAGSTPLHEAALAGDKDTVRWLLSCGAKPAVRNQQGLTPHDIAARKSTRSHQDAAQLLHEPER